MGTSSNLPGPRGGAWTVPHRQLTRWLRAVECETADQENGDPSSLSPEKINLKTQDIARRYLGSLEQTLRNEPDAFGIREAMIDAGGRMVNTLEALRTGRSEWYPLAGGDPADLESSFMQMLVREVAGTGGLAADIVLRRPAAACADELVSAPGPLRDAVLGGQLVKGPFISGELFCLVFKMFFKESVASFITTMIAGKIQVAMPLLRVVDPAGQIARWVGEQVVARIPDPCEKGADLGEAASLADLARALVTESVDNVLGIKPDNAGTVAA